MEKFNKHNYYLDVAEVIAKNKRCIRRNYGAIIVKNDQILATGYNGAPRQSMNCTDIKKCKRQQLNLKSGSNYELCRSVHAEQNCIINASRDEMMGSTLYLVGKEYKTDEYIRNIDCCSICKRMIINAGISLVIVRDDKNNFRILYPQLWINEI